MLDMRTIMVAPSGGALGQHGFDLGGGEAVDCPDHGEGLEAESVAGSRRRATEHRSNVGSRPNDDSSQPRRVPFWPY